MDTIWPDTLATEAGPKYKAVAQIIRAAVAEGTLTQGTRLPPVRDLAWQLKITPGTVARAYTILTDEGLLNAEVGRGTFVAPPVDDDALFAPPIEVDSAAHNREAQDWRVNMVSPHLPSVGQAQLIRNLLADIARDPPSGMMHYPDRTNARPAREAVVKWLAGAQLGHMDQGDVVLANGGQSAIVLLMQALLKGRKPVVLVEELSYPGFRRAADLVRADVVPVAMDAHGVIPEALARAAAQHDAQIFCTSPEVHNPTCLFTPLQRRLELVEVARAHDLQVIDDDCYQIAAAKAPSYRKLAPERGWYVSSISKSLTASLAGGDGHCPAWTCGPAAPCGGTCVLWLADTDPGPDGGLADPSAIARSDRTGTGRYQPVCAGGGEHSGPLRPALERKRALCLAAAARRLARHRILPGRRGAGRASARGRGIRLS